jgi:hypothetical protein
MGALGLLGAGLGSGGCFSPLDLSERSCPCDQGFVCDELRDRCVDLEGVDAGRLDAGRDGGGLDAATDTGGLDGALPDAPSTDAPSTDTPPGDAGTDAGFAPCPTGAHLCDDFESASPTRVPPWEWNNEAPSRTTARALRGAASGRFAIPGDGIILENSVGIDLPRTVDEIYLRFWTYVPSTSNPQNVAIVVLGDGTPPAYFNHSVVLNAFGWGVYNSVSGLYSDGAVVPDDTWTCVVFHAALGTTGRLELLVDGEAPVVGAADTDFPAGPAILGMGITYVAPDQTMPFDIFYDDVAITIDGTPLACP